MTAIGWILVIVGFGWALLGGSTIWDLLSKSVAGKTFSGWGAFGPLLTFMICIAPGLAVGIFGALIVVGRRRRKGQREEQRVALKKCPQCAKKNKVEAKLCRFCGYEFPQPKGRREEPRINRAPRMGPGELTLEEVIFQEEKAPNDPLQDVESVQDKLELLKVKYAELSREIRVSNDEFQKAKLRMEQADIRAVMEKLRLQMSRHKGE